MTAQDAYPPLSQSLLSTQRPLSREPVQPLGVHFHTSSHLLAPIARHNISRSCLVTRYIAHPRYPRHRKDSLRSWVGRYVDRGRFLSCLSRRGNTVEALARSLGASCDEVELQTFGIDLWPMSLYVGEKIHLVYQVRWLRIHEISRDARGERLNFKERGTIGMFLTI